MATGLIALLDDVAALAKIAAASLDDAAAQAVKAGSKAAGIVIDDADRFAPYFVMLPHRHGTDGFFGAVLERRRASAGRA